MRQQAQHLEAVIAVAILGVLASRLPAQIALPDLMHLGLFGRLVLALTVLASGAAILEGLAIAQTARAAQAEAE